MGTPATFRLGNEERTGVLILYSLPGRLKICSVPMKSLFKVAKSPGAIMIAVGGSPPAKSVIWMIKLDIVLRVYPAVPGKPEPDAAVLSWPPQLALPGAVRLMPP